MDRLPAGAVLVGDRNFGVFSIAHAAAAKQLPVILRLTQARFQKLAGESAAPGQDRSVTWLASRDGQRAHLQLPPQAAVRGRLLVAQMQTGSVSELLTVHDLNLPPSRFSNDTVAAGTSRPTCAL